MNRDALGVFILAAILLATAAVAKPAIQLCPPTCPAVEAP